MKTAIKTLILILSTSFVLGIYAQGAKTLSQVTIKTTIYCDHCTKCESCGGQLKKLYDEAGIKKVSVDSEAMKITVTYNPEKTNPDVIRKKIALLGYDADEVKADQKAYLKLDGCCKKN